MERLVYGYISRSTLKTLGADKFLNELSLTFNENALDLAYVRQQAGEFKSWLTQRGYDVLSTDIPIPGKHPHDKIMSGMFTILEIFGVLCCLFCAILVFNLISASCQSSSSKSES